MSGARNEKYVRLCLKKDNNSGRSGILAWPFSIFRERPNAWEFGEHSLANRLVLLLKSVAFSKHAPSRPDDTAWSYQQLITIAG